MFETAGIADNNHSNTSIVSSIKGGGGYMGQPHTSSHFFVLFPRAAFRQGTCTEWNLLSVEVERETAATTL